MAASAGTMVLVGKSGVTQTIDLYIPDAVATLVTFNTAGKAVATSPDSYRVPEDSLIIDITTATAPTAVGGAIKVNSGVINGGTYRYADRLNTLSNRAKLRIPIKAGDFLSVLQH